MEVILVYQSTRLRTRVSQYGPSGHGSNNQSEHACKKEFSSPHAAKGDEEQHVYRTEYNHHHKKTYQNPAPPFIEEKANCLDRTNTKLIVI
jgi:hypothetical protein